MILFNYLFICIIFGTTFFAIKIGIDAGVAPFFSASLRFFIAGVIVILFYKIRQAPFPPLRMILQLAIIGFFLTFGTFSTLYWAEQHIPSGLAAVLSAFGPIMVFLLKKYEDKSKFSPIQVLGLIASLCGVTLIAWPGMNGDVNAIWIIGSIVVILGQLFYSVGTIRSKKIMSSSSQFSPFLLNGFQMLFGGIMLFLLSLIIERPNLASFSNMTAQLSLIYLIFFGSILGHGIFYWLVGKTNPVFPSTWLYVSPIIAMILGITFLSEEIYLISIFGSILVLVGVFFTNQETFKEYYKKGSLIKKVAKNI
ncbi:DMT family transporter [Bacillus sp. SCS-151]|uniref:DMT family transporter n=1 Tax=Nanhaiella sioensis TaxID=3115293 RepID=UPI00397E7F6A